VQIHEISARFPLKNFRIILFFQEILTKIRGISDGNPWLYILNSGLKVIPNYPGITPENCRTFIECCRNFVILIEGIIHGTFFSGMHFVPKITK